MNDNIYQEQEPNILCFRLQSVRRKVRMQHEDFEKQLLAMYWKRKDLYKQQRALGWVELKPPVIHGWKRYFVLREDIARSKHAAFFEGILQKINNVEYSNRKDFKVKKRKQGKKVYVLKNQQLSQPNEWHFKKLKFSEKEAQFFEVRYVKKKWMKQPEKTYVFVEPWRFVPRIRPNVITRTRARDEEIESQIHHIDTYVKKNFLDGKMYRLLDGSYQWKSDSEKVGERNYLKNKPVTAILDLIAKEAQ